MRMAKLSVILTMAFTVFICSLCSAQQNAQTNDLYKDTYFEVKSPIANVYKELDPKSEIIKQVMVGERLQLVAQGTSWHNVKVDSKEGWIENQAGKIVKGEKPFPIFNILFLLLLIAGTGYFVFTRITKTQATETEEV